MGGSCSGLGGNPSAHAICGFVDGVEGDTLTVAVSEGGGKSIAGTNGVSDLDAESGMIRTAFAIYQNASEGTASDADKFKSVVFKQEFGISELVVR